MPKNLLPAIIHYPRKEIARLRSTCEASSARPKVRWRTNVAGQQNWLWCQICLDCGKTKSWIMFSSLQHLQTNLLAEILLRTQNIHNLCLHIVTKRVSARTISEGIIENCRLEGQNCQWSWELTSKDGPGLLRPEPQTFTNKFCTPLMISFALLSWWSICFVLMHMTSERQIQATGHASWQIYGSEPNATAAGHSFDRSPLHPSQTCAKSVRVFGSKTNC